MKFRRNKKGFTIVELIIVIAVIGILTAVMVPTIVHLVGKANKASDEALVSNLNKAVQLRYSETGKKPETMHETVEGLKEYGYNVDALVAKSDESLLYNLEENKFVLEKSEGVLGHEENFWKVQDELGDQKYNVYAGRNFSMDPVTGLHTGFDAADKSISSITFESGAAKTYLVRTNGGTFTVNSASSSIEHRGNVNELMITAVKKNASYHEYGVVAVKATLVSGSLDVMPDGYIKEVDTAGADAGSTLAVDGYVSKVVAAEGEGAIKATGNGYVANNAGEPMGTPAAIDTSISSVADLIKFKDKVNGGQSFAGLTVKLTADLDISGMAWEPIGKANAPFKGTFDGQNHSITGLTNADYQIDNNDVYITNTIGSVGAPYGFFRAIGGGENEETTIKNLSLKDININFADSVNLVAGLVAGTTSSMGGAATTSEINIQNVSVSGNIKAVNKTGVAAGGIVGKFYHAGRGNFINCTSFVNIDVQEGTSGTAAAKDMKVAGIAAWASDGAGVYVFDGCKNYGDMKANTSAKIFAAGIACKSGGVAYFKNCSTQGKTTLETPVTPSTVEEYKVFYSVLGRAENLNTTRATEIQETYTFDGTSYYMYDDSNGANKTYLSVEGCSISNDSNYSTFKTVIKEGNSETEYVSSTENLDFLNLYNFRYIRWVPELLNN